MHGGAAEDRDHHAREGRRALNESQNRTTTDDLCDCHHPCETGLARGLYQGRQGLHRRDPPGEGCLSYESHTSINDPNLFVVVERWESREDLNAHGRAPHMKVWREISAPLKFSPTVIEIISDGKVETF